MPAADGLPPPPSPPVPARRLAILDVLSRRGPLPLGVAIFEAGVGTRGALRDAAELERLGLIAVARPTGRNLSETCTITPSGSRALGSMGMRADARSTDVIARRPVDAASGRARFEVRGGG